MSQSSKMQANRRGQVSGDHQYAPAPRNPLTTNGKRRRIHGTVTQTSEMDYRTDQGGNLVLRRYIRRCADPVWAVRTDHLHRPQCRPAVAPRALRGWPADRQHSPLLPAVEPAYNIRNLPSLRILHRRCIPRPELPGPAVLQTGFEYTC